MAKNKNRPTRERRTEKIKKKKPYGVPEWESVPTKYGQIPLVTKTLTMSNGTKREHRVLDLDFRPSMPPGAVRGNPRRQVYGYDIPGFYFADETRCCRDCRRSFVFSASEQKFWYEELQFYLWIGAVRCLPCRKSKRAEHALTQRLEAAIQELKDQPDSVDAHLGEAEARVRYFERHEEGNLERVVAVCRRARKLAPGRQKIQLASFWEGRAQMLLGRSEEARRLLSEVSESLRGRGTRDVIKASREILEELERSEAESGGQ